MTPNGQDYYYRDDGAVVFHREHTQRKGLIDLCEEVVAIIGNYNGRMVEIGAHAGESGEIFARHFSKVFCLDTWGWDELQAVSEKLPVHEVERSFDLRMAKSNGVMTKVRARSPAAAKLFPDGFFDFVYIDGAHDEASVRADIKAWLPKTRCLIGGHDWVDEAEGVRTAVLALLGAPLWLFEDYSWMTRLTNSSMP